MPCGDVKRLPCILYRLNNEFYWGGGGGGGGDEGCPNVVEYV